MPARTLPGAGLRAYYDAGELGWQITADPDFRLVSVLLAGFVVSSTTALPGSGTLGDIYIVPSDALSDANKVAVWDGPSGSEAWVYIDPREGWTFRDTGNSITLEFDGSAWVALAPETVGAIGDVDLVTAAPLDGQTLVWDLANAVWVPGDAVGGAGATDIDDLDDVDTSTTAPTDGQTLVWDAAAAAWVPGDAVGGGGSVAKEPISTVIDLASVQTYSIPDDATRVVFHSEDVLATGAPIIDLQFGASGVAQNARVFRTEIAPTTQTIVAPLDTDSFAAMFADTGEEIGFHGEIFNPRSAVLKTRASTNITNETRLELMTSAVQVVAADTEQILFVAPSETLTGVVHVTAYFDGVSVPGGGTSGGGYTFAGAAVRLSANGAATNFTAGPIVDEWDVEAYDTHDFWDAGSPDVFTIPPGVSKVRAVATIYLENAGTSDYNLVESSCAGVRYGSMRTHAESANQLVTIVADIPVSDGDEVGVSIFTQADTSANLRSDRSQFSIHAIDGPLVTAAVVRPRVVTKTGTAETLEGGDLNAFVLLSNAGAITYTLNDTIGVKGDIVTLKQKGAGAVTIAAGTGTPEVNASRTLVTDGQNALVTMICEGAGVWAVGGDLVAS